MNAVNIAVETFSLVICLMLLFFTLVRGDKSRQNSFFIAICTSNAVALISDILSYLPLSTSSGVVILKLMVFITFLAGYVMNTLFIYYSLSVMSSYCKVNMWIARMSIISGLISMIFVVMSFFNGICFRFEDGRYIQSDYYWIADFQFILMIVLCVSYYLWHRKEVPSVVSRSLMSYPLFPLAALVPQIMNIGIEFMYASATLSILVMYISIQVIQNVELREKEAELSETRVQLVMSQVQPHFIFNSLSAISYLCKTDPELAGKTVSVFSRYLRGNLDFSSEQKTVSFSTERKHIEAYLYLEKLRFEDRLNIEYDIQYEGFMLPALSVQPIIENAVKHGLCPKLEGGTVKISTYRDEENIYVVVEDNGIGYDTDKPLDKKHSHIGINNVRKRLELLCGGRIEINSQVGVGTKITMIIPAKSNISPVEQTRFKSVG